MYGSSPILASKDLALRLVALKQSFGLWKEIEVSVSEPPVVHLVHIRNVEVSAREDGNSHYSDGVVVKDGWDIFRRELIGSVTDEKTCLSNCTVADNHTPRHNKISSAALRSPQ